jgi:type III secretion protein W
MQSQETGYLVRTRLLVAQHNKRLDPLARDLRKQLKNIQSSKQDPKETLLRILESCGGDAATAHQRLQYAIKQVLNEQARNEGEETELPLLRQQLSLLITEHTRPVQKPTTAAVKGRDLARTLRTTQRQKASGARMLYSVMVNDSRSIVALIEALINERREHDEFASSFKEMRSEIATDIGAVISSRTFPAQSLMSGLTTTLKAAALLHECEDMLGRMSSKNPKMPKLEAIALLKHLLTLITTQMNVEQTKTLVELIGGERLSNRLACFNALNHIIQYRFPIALLNHAKDFIKVKNNLRELSTELTNDEQKLAQEKLALCNL